MAELSDPKGVANGIIIRLPVRGTTNWDLDFELETMGPIMAHNHHGNGSGAKLTTQAFTDNAITIDKIAHIQIISEDTTITESVSNMHYILDASQSTPITLTFNGADEEGNPVTQTVDNCLFTTIGKVSTATISLESDIRFMNNRVNSLDSSKINLQNIDLTDFVIENNIIFTNSIVADFEGLDTGITGDNNSSSLFQYNVMHVSFQGNNTTAIKMPLGTFSGNKITFIGTAYLQTYVTDNVSATKHSNIPSNRGNIIDFLDAYSGANSSYSTVDNPTTNNTISFTDTRPFRILSNDTKVSLKPNLGDAHDVNLSSEQTNQLLKYDGSQWVNGKAATDSIEDSAVTTAKIANDAVTTDKLINFAVTDGKIANQTITGNKLADKAVTGGKIADATITDTNIQNLTITGSKIANDTITADKLQDNISGVNPVKLSSLADVSSASPSNGQALAWNDDLSAWQPQTISGGSGGGVAENSFVGIVTEWQEYTPTFNSGFTVGTGGNATNKFEYRRIGENIEIRFYIQLGTSGASMGTGTFEFNLPTGLSMPSEFVQRGDDYPVTGFVRLGNYTTPGTDQTSQIFVNNGSTNTFVVGNDGNLGVVSSTQPWTWDAQDFIVCPSMTVPILGWDAVGLIDQSGSVDVALLVKKTGTQTLQNQVNEKITYQIVDTDTTNSWDASNNWFVVPETGYYDISFSGRISGDNTPDQYRCLAGLSVDTTGTGSSFNAKLVSEVGPHGGRSAGGITFNANGVYLEKGHLAYVYMYQHNTDGETNDVVGGSDGLHVWLSIAKRNSSQAIISGVGSDINYISNAKAVVNLAGWNEYDGTTAIPSGTISGTASLTFERNEANPLRGSADFKLTTTSASLGEGVAYDFSVQRADLAKKMLIEFEYDASHSGYEDGDVKVFVYDVTNSNLIRVNGEDLRGGKGTHFAQFQTSANGADYRLLFHVTSANVYSIYLDDIKVSPVGVNDSVNSRDVVCNINGLASSQTVNSATDTHITGWNTPYKDTTNSWDAVNNKYVIPETGYYDVNLQVQINGDSTTNDGSGNTVAGSDITRVIAFVKIDGTILRIGGVVVDGSIENNFASVNIVGYFLEKGQEITFFVRQDNSDAEGNTTFDVNGQRTFFDIAKRPSLSLPESVGSGRDVYVVGRESGGTYTITAETERIPFTILEDSTGSMSTTDNGPDTFTVPETGSYTIEGNVACASTTITNQTINAFVNGSLSRSLQTSDSGTDRYKHFSGILRLNKGDVLDFRFSPGANVIIENVGTHHWIHIEKLSSAQTVLETETVAARYTSSAGGQIPSSASSPTPLLFENKDTDTHNAYNTSTGVYTFPVSGYYAVDCKVGMYGRDSAIGTRVFLASSIDGSGANDVTLDTEAAAGSGAYNFFTLDGSYVKYFNKGQTINIFISQNTGSQQNLTTSEANMYVSIIRIK